MTKKITGAVLALLMALLLVPVMAFAEGGHTIDNLDLVYDNNHEGKTLAADGYTWDARKAVLTMQNLTVTGTVTLPNMECTVNVKGTCSVESLSRADSGAAQSVIISGEGQDLTTFRAKIHVSGELQINNLTMTDGEISSASEGLEKLLSLKNSNITLHHLSWMTDGGIQLASSVLQVKSNGGSGQFWVEKIIMDEASVIESEHPLTNYGKMDITETFINVGKDHILAPEGGYFARYQRPGTEDTYNTIVMEKTENGVAVVEWATSFTLGKPKATQPEQPAENEPVKEPEKEPEKPAERPVRRYSNVTAAVEEAPKTIEAAKTGDPGVVLYAASAVLSAAGMAWAGRKRGQ